jgi:hypothetical protein
MRKNPTYTALLRPTRLLISEKSGTYTIKWSYTIIWQVRVFSDKSRFSDNFAEDHFLVHKNISFSDNLVFSAPLI